MLGTPCPECDSSSTQVKIRYDGPDHYHLVRVCPRCDADTPESEYWVPDTRRS